MLYVITNRHLISSGDLLEVVENALKAGVKNLILREKDLPESELLVLAEKTKKLTENYGARLIISNNVEIAEKIGANGVQLSMKWFNSHIYFEGAVGASVHSLEEAEKALHNGADYLLVSHIFPTDCKKGLKEKGVGLIESVRAITDKPIIALGGIRISNIQSVLEAGADGVAIMSGIMSAENTEEAVRKYMEMLA